VSRIDRSKLSEWWLKHLDTKFDDQEPEKDMRFASFASGTRGKQINIDLLGGFILLLFGQVGARIIRFWRRTRGM